MLFTMASQINNGHAEHETITLPEGVDVPVRPIRPDDVPALQRLHSRLSEQTIYLRFFGPVSELSENKAQYFAHIDGIDHFALVALDPSNPEEIIAFVRYDREPGEERAEYAAIVEDSWQERGLGMRLTRMLIDVARNKEVQFLYGLVMPQNKRMLNLLRDLDLPEQERREDSAKYVEVELGPGGS